MENNFSWNDSDFIEKYIHEQGKIRQEIMDVECIRVFKYFFSANQVLFYAHTSLVKLHDLFKHINEHPEKFDDYEFLQQAQTEANFFIFTFLQTILPYRDLIKNTELLDTGIFNSIFKNNDECDFFVSLRNFQTHVISPIFTWSVTNRSIDSRSYFDIRFDDNILNNIKFYMNNSKSNAFKRGGYNFIVKNKETKIYILANNFFEYLYLIHEYCYKLFLLKYKKNIDECEYFLKKAADYTRSCTEYILKKSIPNFKNEDKNEYTSVQYYYILKELGCEPKLMKDLLMDEIYLEKS